MLFWNIICNVPVSEAPLEKASVTEGLVEWIQVVVLQDVDVVCCVVHLDGLLWVSGNK